MNDIHQALAHGIAHDLRPPPGTTPTILHLASLPTPAGSWAVRYSTTTHSAVQIPVGTVFLQPEALEYHGRSGTINQLDYEDPDLLERLQKLLDDTDARYIIPLYGED